MNPYKEYCKDVHQKIRSILLMHNLENEDNIKLETNKSRVYRGKISGLMRRKRFERVLIEYQIQGYERIFISFVSAYYVDMIRSKNFKETPRGFELSTEEFTNLILNLESNEQY